MLKLKGSVIFISDVHLGASQKVDDRFEKFLDKLDPEITIVSLGDLVDFWAEGPDYDLSDLYPVLHKFKLRQSFFLKGNRDFLIGKRWEEATGGKVLGDRVEIEAHSKRLVALHGDTLVTGDLRYQLWRRIARSGLFSVVTGMLGKQRAIKYAEGLRKGSEIEVQRKPRQSMEINLKRAHQERGNCDLLLCGHVHKPSNKDGIITLGAWDGGAETLLLDRNGIHFPEL